MRAARAFAEAASVAEPPAFSATENDEAERSSHPCPTREVQRLCPGVRGSHPPVSAPPTIVVDPEGLQALVAEVAAQDSYGFDTEFHTERTYVPDLALIQIAWADKVALVDPLAVDPAPLAAGLRRARCRRGATPRRRTSMCSWRRAAPCPPSCSTPRSSPVSSASPHHRCPAWWTRCWGSRSPRPTGSRTGSCGPISERQISYALNDVAYLLELRDVLTERLAGARAAGVGPRVNAIRCSATAPARVPEEAWWKLGDIRGMSRRSRPWRRRWRRGASGRPPRPTGPAAWCCRTSGCWRSSQRPPRNGDELRPPAASTGATWRRAGLPRSCGPSSAASSSHPGRSGMPSEGRDAPAPAGRGGRVLGPGAADRRRPRFRPGPPRHAGRHRAAALRRAQPARYGLAPHHRRRSRCAG